MKLVFTWIQWCGKGTQARKLVENHGFKLLEMWGEFRKIIASGTELGQKLKAVLDSGAQVDDTLGKEIMESVILEQTEENIIFDGFIRNDWNKEIFDRILPDYQVIWFQLPEEKAIDRLLGRMYDPKTWETFPSSVVVNPKTGTELIKRKDDNEAAILKRIDEYTIKTLPIVEIQKNEGKVIEINADQTPEDVYSEIVKKLSL